MFYYILFQRFTRFPLERQVDQGDPKLTNVVDSSVFLRESLDSVTFNGNPAGRAGKAKISGQTARLGTQILLCFSYVKMTTPCLGHRSQPDTRKLRAHRQVQITARQVTKDPVRGGTAFRQGLGPRRTGAALAK